MAAQQKSTVYRDARSALLGRDSLAETPWSKLFHEARTTSRDVYTSAAAPVKVVHDEIVVGDVVKTRQGEHYHVRDTDWDGVVTIPIRTFMSVEAARNSICQQLRRLAQKHDRQKTGPSY